MARGCREPAAAQGLAGQRHDGRAGAGEGDAGVLLRRQGQLGAAQLPLELGQIARGDMEALQRVGELLGGQLVPGELGVEALAVAGDLVLRQLAGLPQPAVRVGVKATPVEEGVQVDDPAGQFDAVLLESALQLGVLLSGGGQDSKAGGPEGNERPPRPPAAALTPIRSCRGACW